MEGTKEFTGSNRNGSDRDTSVEPKQEVEGLTKVDDDALQSAEAFYNMFKSACHGITRRQELDTLYNATYLSFCSNCDQRPEFSKVLFAMARGMKVLKVIRGGTISWKAFSHQDDQNDNSRDDRRPRFDDQRRDDRRPQYDAGRDDRRPRFDDQRRDERRPQYDAGRDDRRPRFDDQRRDDRRPRFDDQRTDDRRPRFDDQRRDERRPQYHARRDDRGSEQVSSREVRAMSIERQ